MSNAVIEKAAQTSVILFAIGMLLTKFSSFLTNMVLSYKYGASVISDAVIISMNIPVILFAGFISAVSLCYIPLYKEAEREKPAKGLMITSLFMNVLTAAVACVCVLLFIFPEFFIYVLANGMSEAGITLAGRITRWVAVAALLTGASGILGGYLQANNRFRLVSISGLPINLILAFCILLSKEDNIILFIGTGFILASLVRFLLYNNESVKIGFVWVLVFNLKDPYLKKLLLMVAPVVLGTLLYDINTIVDKSFASFLDVGSISVLDYSYKVAAAAQGILAFPLTTILYTRLSEDSSRKDFVALSNSLNDGISRLSFFMIPAISGMIVVADIIVKILFFRGNFNIEAVRITSDCLILYLIGMYAISYRALLEKVFYSLQLTRLTFQNTIITVLTNIIMDMLLYKYFGCYGLAVATSISLIVSLCYLIVLMKKKTGIIIERTNLINIFKMVAASSAMMVGMTGVRHLFIDTITGSFVENIIVLAVISVIGFVTYGAVLLLLRERQSWQMLNTIIERCLR